MDTVKVNISDFSSCVGYCQFIIVNKYHLKLRPEPSPHLRRGALVHRILETEDKLIPRKEATEEQLMNPLVDLDFTREGVYVCIERVNQNRFRYIGRVDKIVRKDGDVYIIDDKVIAPGKTPVPYSDKFLQIACYCEGFLRNYSYLLRFNRMFLNIVYRDSKGRVLEEFKKEYESEMKDILHQNFKVFEDIYNGARKPEHHNNPNKCKACRFRSSCKFRV
jgi:hypothetical protein